MPTPRSMLGLAALDDILYAIGGTPGGNATGPCPTAAGKPCATPKYPSGTVEIFDPEKRTWRSGKSLTMPRWGLAVAASDGALYAIGGYAQKPTAVGSAANTHEHHLRDSEAYAVASQVVEMMNPYVSDAWTRKSNMHCARVFAAAAVLPYDQQGVIFVTGGRNSTSPGVYKSVHLTMLTSCTACLTRASFLFVVCLGATHCCSDDIHGSVLPAKRLLGRKGPHASTPCHNCQLQYQPLCDGMVLKFAHEPCSVARLDVPLTRQRSSMESSTSSVKHLCFCSNACSFRPDSSAPTPLPV
eukprot:COSAG02_NODE_2794_length_8016_cov_5.159783_5_plen_299_part_00